MSCLSNSLTRKAPASWTSPGSGLARLSEVPQLWIGEPPQHGEPDYVKLASCSSSSWLGNLTTASWQAGSPPAGWGTWLRQALLQLVQDFAAPTGSRPISPIIFQRRQHNLTFIVSDIFWWFPRWYFYAGNEMGELSRGDVIWGGGRNLKVHILWK